MSEKRVIKLEDISSSPADIELIVRADVSHPPFGAREEKAAGERGEESPLGGPEGSIEVGGVCKTEAGTEADVEDEDKEVDVVGGVAEPGVSGYESGGFTLSQILHRKKLAKKNVSESVVDIAHLPQYELSNLQRLPLNFPLEIFCRPVIELY